MVRKFLSKYILEVIPSIVATVIGAYIVTHYINGKPDADKPQVAVTSPTEKPGTVLLKSSKISPAKAEASSEKQPGDKVEKFDAANAPSEQRRHQPQLREKAVAKAAPATSTPAPPVEAAAKTEDTRDANEIARAAIERLRGSELAATAEAPRQQSRVSVTYQPAPALVQPPQVQTVAPVASAPSPLPETTIAPAPQPVARADDPMRPMPPADIPSRPLDIRSKTAERTTVAEDVVSVAKSVFHAVIPGTN